MNLSTVLLVIHQQWYHNRWRNYDCDVMVKIKRNSSGVSNRPKISRFYNTQFSCFIIFVILIFALYWAVHLFHTNIKEAWVHVCYIHARQQKSTFSLMIINHEFKKKQQPRFLSFFSKFILRKQRSIDHGLSIICTHSVALKIFLFIMRLFPLLYIINISF